MTHLADALRDAGLHAVRDAEPMSAHTTLRVGGPADAFVRADTGEDLALVAKVCADQRRPWLVVGRGSNLLVDDAGWPGVVITLGRGFRGVVADRSDEAHVIVDVGGAEPMPVLATTVARRGLGGMAFGVAIPGLFGGAVRMNAGAHGRQMRDVLVDVDVVRLGADVRLDVLTAEDLRMRYRETDLPEDAVVVRGRVRLRRDDANALAAEMTEMRQWRRDNQPINEPSCGSVFRNPPGDSAGRLIEAAGMKGHRIGGAQVSPLHANFITVTPGSRAQDVHDLITTVSRAVFESSGVQLQTEVVIAGFGPGGWDGSGFSTAEGE